MEPGEPRLSPPSKPTRLTSSSVTGVATLSEDLLLVVIELLLDRNDTKKYYNQLMIFRLVSKTFNWIIENWQAPGPSSVIVSPSHRHTRTLSGLEITSWKWT